MTSNADAFALHDLRRRFHTEKAERGEPQLILVASDGELYGHHQPFRDYFLAHLMKGASTQVGITPTFPALWLREHPPRRTIGIRDNTSWSCHHGVMRWAGDCACAPGEHGWKAAFRRALDELAAALDEQYLQAVSPFVADPWQLRHRYISVILGLARVEDVLIEMAGQALPAETLRRLSILLEAQRERQRMYTSCGWFFDDFDRIEPKNNVAYATQAVLLTYLATGVDLAPRTLQAMRGVVSWRSGLRADQVFAQYLERGWNLRATVTSQARQANTPLA